WISVEIYTRGADPALCDRSLERDTRLWNSRRRKFARVCVGQQGTLDYNGKRARLPRPQRAGAAGAGHGSDDEGGEDIVSSVVFRVSSVRLSCRCFGSLGTRNWKLETAVWRRYVRHRFGDLGDCRVICPGVDAVNEHAGPALPQGRPA